MISKQDLFPTPVFSIEVPLYQELNPPLLKKVYELKESDQGITKSNVLGWHSSGKLDDLKEFAFLKGFF